MALQFAPKLGAIVMCDFPDCFDAPEMVKRRAVIVVNRRIPGRTDLLTVVPISNTPPDPTLAHHCLLPDDVLPSFMRDGRGRWVKADMLYTLSTSRMRPCQKPQRENGKRVYEYPKLDLAQLRQVRICIGSALGIDASLYSESKRDQKLRAA